MSFENRPKRPLNIRCNLQWENLICDGRPTARPGAALIRTAFPDARSRPHRAEKWVLNRSSVGYRSKEFAIGYAASRQGKSERTSVMRRFAVRFIPIAIALAVVW